MTSRRAPRTVEWDLSGREWTVDSNGRVLVFREHWFASRGAIPEVPEVLLRDVTHLRTLLRPIENEDTTVWASGTACPLTWTRPPAPQQGGRAFRFGVTGASVILHSGSLAWGRIGTCQEFRAILATAGLTERRDPQLLIGTFGSCVRVHHVSKRTLGFV